MTVGWQGSSQQLQHAAVGLAQQFAAAAAGAVALNTFVQGITTGASPPGLAAYGFSTADATAFEQLLGVLAQYAAVYYGQQAEPTVVNFAQELAQLVGPPVPSAVANVAAEALAGSGLAS